GRGDDAASASLGQGEGRYGAGGAGTNAQVPHGSVESCPGLRKGFRAVDRSEKWRRLISFGYLSFLLLWQLCACAELVKLQLDHELFFLRRGGQPYISDFVDFYEAAVLVGSQDRFRVYDPVVQNAWTNRLIYPEHLDTPFYFQYPPFAFPLLSPLRFLPL